MVLRRIKSRTTSVLVVRLNDHAYCSPASERLTRFQLRRPMSLLTKVPFQTLLLG